MPARPRQKKSPQRLATEYFIAGVVAIIAAIFINATGVSCSTVDGVQLCTQYTYYGLDAHTFAIVLIVAALLCFAAGVYYLMRHRKELGK